MIFEKKKLKAFTLIELVIVIAILAILMAIAIPKFQEAKERAAITAHNANVRAIENAASLYLIDHPDHPKNTSHATDKTIYLSDLEGYLQDSNNIKPYKGGETESTQFTITVNGSGELVVTPGIIEKQK